MNGKKKQTTQSRYNEHFERINATPEQLAKMIMQSEPKGLEEWKCLATTGFSAN